MKSCEDIPLDFAGTVARAIKVLKDKRFCEITVLGYSRFDNMRIVITSSIKRSFFPVEENIADSQILSQFVEMLDEDDFPITKWELRRYDGVIMTSGWFLTGELPLSAEEDVACCILEEYRDRYHKCSRLTKLNKNIKELIIEDEYYPRPIERRFLEPMVPKEKSDKLVPVIAADFSYRALAFTKEKLKGKVERIRFVPKEDILIVILMTSFETKEGIKHKWYRYLEKREKWFLKWEIIENRKILLEGTSKISPFPKSLSQKRLVEIMANISSDCPLFLWIDKKITAWLEYYLRHNAWPMALYL